MAHKGKTQLDESDRRSLVEYAANHGADAAAVQFQISKRQVFRIIKSQKCQESSQPARFDESYILKVRNQLVGGVGLDRLSEILEEIPGMLERLITLERERVDRLKVTGPSEMEKLVETQESTKKRIRWKVK